MDNSAGYVPLHVHTHYSLLDGLSKPKDLIARCVEYGIGACAITDHGVLFGAQDFYGAAKEAGVKPIIGCELYVSPTTHTDKSGKSSSDASDHLVLLCRSEEGYHNLCKLSSIAHIEGRHYKPRVDDELLARHAKGLMASSACLGGRIPRLLRQGRLDEADETAGKYAEIFGRDGFFIEMMNHGMAEEEEINPLLADMARRHGLLHIATNDSHYTDREDYEAHEILLCIQTQKTLDSPERMRMSGNEYYFRTPDEMRGLFARWPEAVSNTLLVAERCEFKMPGEMRLIPDYAPPRGFTKQEYLKELVMRGLVERYGDPVPASHIARAEYELNIIETMQFTDYFLVVWDLINHARVEHIPVGPGRGSGAGSLVAYALKITNIEPLRFNLLFERFLNPERVSMPDFDIDFCFRRRDEMITYARDRYGAPNVSQIVTYGRMLSRNVVRNVGRVLGMPLGDVNRICGLLPNDPKKKLKDALEEEAELRRLVQEDPQVSRLWRLASRLEGTINSVGVHAAGVVICDHDLTDHVALFKAANSDTVVTQAEMKGVEKIGLLKMDFLGLRTLTVVHDAVRLIREGRGVDLDIDNITMTDARTYELLRSGETMGVFQLESSGMRDLARRIGLESIEEMSALVALYRPGPMQFIDTYIDCKFHPERVEYDHPSVADILRETYGIAVYQEQVMQMVQAAAGFSLGHADIMRRAMGKKNQAELDKQKAAFVEGCARNGIGKALAETLWAKIEKFAGYGFNKSHSVAYAFVAYQTAYLKANYPVEYMCALLTSEIGNLEKAAVYIEECRRMNIAVLPPDVNHSMLDFSVEGEAIRFGLSAVRNVGEVPARAIVEGRADGPYTDIYDFCKRLDTSCVNARVVESLNKAGAFASTGWNRRQVDSAVEKAISEGQVVQRDKAIGQTSLFDMGGTEESFPAHLRKAQTARMAGTRALGGREGNAGAVHQQPSAPELPGRGGAVQHGGPEGHFGAQGGRRGDDRGAGVNGPHDLHQEGRQDGVSAAGGPLQGPAEVTIFTDLYEQKATLLVADLVVVCTARVNYREDKLSFVANDLVPVDDAERYLSRALHVRVHPPRQQPEVMKKLALLLGSLPGPCDVYLHCGLSDGGEVVVHAPNACRVAPSKQLRYVVEELLGQDTVFFSAGMRPAKPPAAQGVPAAALEAARGKLSGSANPRKESQPRRSRDPARPYSFSARFGDVCSMQAARTSPAPSAPAARPQPGTVPVSPAWAGSVT